MDVYYSPTDRNADPQPVIPHRTPGNTVEELLFLCTVNDLESFEDQITQLLMQPESFAIEELGDVMIEAIKKDNAAFASRLLHHGFPINAYYTTAAISYKSKGVLMAYIKAGWDVNEPTSEIAPPVLG